MRSVFSVLFTSLMLLLPMNVSAAEGSPVVELLDLMKTSCLSFDYSFTMKGRTTVNIDGHGIVQGQCYKVDSGSMSFISDGVTRWVVDEDAMEVIIEEADADSDFLSNPIVLLTAFDRYLELVNVDSSSPGVQIAEFKPVKNNRIKSVTAGISVRKAVPVMDYIRLVSMSGEITELRFSGMSFSHDKRPIAAFVFDVNKTGGSWVVTDLR